MAAISVRRNVVVNWLGVAYRLVDVPEGDYWRLISLSDGTSKSISKAELLAEYRRKNLRFRSMPDDTRDLAAAHREATDPPLKVIGKALKTDRLILIQNEKRQERELAARKLAMLVKFYSKYPLGSLIQQLAIRQEWPNIFGVAAPSKLPSTASLARWEKKYDEAGGDVRSLIAAHHLKGRAKTEVSDKVQEIIAEATVDVYLTLNRRPILEVQAEIIGRIDAENIVLTELERLKIPPLERIKEHIHSLPAFEKRACRYGLQSAQRKFRAVLDSVFANLPLERVELDATRLDFIAVNDQGLPMGRPWLHVCIDVRTRCVLGYYISYEPPSLASLFECLKHAILPKDGDHFRALGCENEYPCYGAFQKLVVDNALENHSDALFHLLDVWGGEIQNCPRAAPWYKARIERFIGTFGEQVCHMLPGTTFSNVFERGEYDPVENAVIHWRDFERIVAIWIVDVYHNKTHRTLQCSPVQAWTALTRNEELLIPCDVSDIEQVCRVAELRRLTHKGVESLGIYWNSDDLTAMRYEIGSEVDVRVFFNRMNLGVVGVEHPVTRRIVEVKALAFEYANNLTLHQHKVTRAFEARFSDSREDNVRSWINAQRKMLEIIKDACFAKGYTLTSGASRFLLGNGKRELPEGQAVLAAQSELTLPEIRNSEMDVLLLAAGNGTDDVRDEVDFEESGRVGVLHRTKVG